jgi:hypothetical protein
MKKLSLLILAGAFTMPTFARESWPAPTEEAKARTAGFKAHEQEVLKQIQPELDAWAKKGKPFFVNARIPSDLPQADVPAFPGAEGAGKFSFGGRGGKIFVVTNLADSGPGTLREAVESAGPRIVVFNVAGIIHLTKPLFVKAPYLTLCGQTAPGDGICVAGESTLIDTHDVIIRYMRFRRGNGDVFDRDDALGGQPIGNIIVDHCSCSWGGDENISMYRHIVATNGENAKFPTLNLTLQWNISSEALNPYNHAFGGTWGGRNTSFHHNLFANNTARNASIGMTYDFNFINNVLFNWQHRTLDGGDKDSAVNCISNYYKPGPRTLDGAVRYRIGMPQPTITKAEPSPRFGKWFVAGNIVESNATVTADNWAGGIQFSAGGSKEFPQTDPLAVIQPLVERVRADKPFPMSPVKIETAAAAFESVLAGAGATLPRRDSVDERAARETKIGVIKRVAVAEVAQKPMKGLTKNDLGAAGDGIITEVAQVGGYPEYKGEPFKDVGADGIPLWWKNKFKLDAKDAALAPKDLQGDGYTVIEKFLYGLDPTKKIDWKNPASQLNQLTADNFKK